MFIEVDVNDVVEKCITLSEHKLALQDIQLETHLQPGLPKVQGDFNQLQQCVINLILNAIDAMPSGGVLKVRSSFHTDKKMNEIRQYRKSHFVTLSKAKGLRQIISATSCHLDRRERSFEVGWDPKISRFARNDSCSDDFCGTAK
jgi:signal transduction histidine kinase